MAATGMDGNRMGAEIAAEIIETYTLSGLGFPGYIFNSLWFVIFWQAVGRAIVRHIQENQVVTTPVIDYAVGEMTTEFPSIKVE